MTKDTQSRKWLITINNPADKGYTHEKIKDTLSRFQSCVYWCMSDEVGNKGKTPHTHIYMACSSGVRFGTLAKRFEGGHFDYARGTSQQNRDYVFKLGKYENTTKEDTRVDGTQEEWGEMPVERQGKRNDLVDLYDLVKSGKTDAEILEISPESMLTLSSIRDARQVITYDKYKNTFRELDVTYIFGVTGSGKTRSVMEEYGYENVYRVTNYKHPFDAYQNQDVILFEEFRSSLPLGDMLKYLDGYPLDLPCRYNDKQACYTKVYFCTNIGLADQYPNESKAEKESWKALLRRIHHVVYRTHNKIERMTVEEYMTNPLRYTAFQKADGKEIPFNDA